MDKQKKSNVRRIDTFCLHIHLHTRQHSVHLEAAVVSIFALLSHSRPPTHGAASFPIQYCLYMYGDVRVEIIEEAL